MLSSLSLQTEFLSPSLSTFHLTPKNLPLALSIDLVPNIPRFQQMNSFCNFLIYFLVFQIS